MDTISSRESNTNYLPLAGVIAGVAALLLAIFAFVKISSLKNEVAELNKIADRVAGVESQVNQVANAAQVANDTRNNLMNVARDTNNSFKQVSDQLGEIRGRLDKVEAARPAVTQRPPAQQAGGAATPATPSGDVYVVKSGDTGTSIFRTTGFTQAQIEAVNPGIDWRRLHVGQRVVLPKK